MGSWNSLHDEVRDHTAAPLNKRIDTAVEARVACLASLERQDIARRLTSLERLPDVGRAIDLTAAAFTLVGTGLLRTGGLKWLALPVISSLVLLQRAFTGTALPAALFRRLGLRTRREMDIERYALKALRGDFSRIPHDGGPKLRANAALVAAQS